MKVLQFVMAYEVDHDQLRACIPAGFHSLRPVLRINGEIRETEPETAYLEFNTAVEGYRKRGWLNIGHWESTSSNLSYTRAGKTVNFTLPNLKISFTGVGIEGGCPAEGDNQGIFFAEAETALKLSESIEANREFCDCEFAWRMPGGAHGISTGNTIPTYFNPPQNRYARCDFSVKSAAMIPCKQVLGAYQVSFDRKTAQMEESIMHTITLNDGNKIPTIGFGVFMIPNDGSTYTAVKEALAVGYRHIDTATAYFNEEEVGTAIKDSGIPREEIFITSKLWLSHYGYERAKVGIERSLRMLGMDYIDLYLIHQPYGDVPGAWKAMEEAKAEGKLRSIGVSNMTPKIWNAFVPQFATKPAVNQLEFNPFFQQKAIREMMAKDDVKLEAWYPLGHGDETLLSHPVIVRLAEKYSKNPGQIILRFEVQEGIITLPKSTHPERIKGNLELFDFQLTQAEMDALRALDTGKGAHDPDVPGVGEVLLNAYKIEG